MSQNNVPLERHCQKFSKLYWEKIVWRHLLKSPKYGICKVLLAIITTTITQLGSLFVLYYWSSHCRSLRKLLMKWTQFINNYQKSILGGPTIKQFVLQACFFYVLPRHTNIMTDKARNFFDKCASRCVLPSSWGDTKMYTSGSIANSQRMLDVVNESDAIAKIRIWVEKDTVKHYKHLE